MRQAGRAGQVKARKGTTPWPGNTLFDRLACHLAQ